jgi:hypothetical protein
MQGRGSGFQLHVFICNGQRDLGQMIHSLDIKMRVERDALLGYFYLLHEASKSQLC